MYRRVCVITITVRGVEAISILVNYTTNMVTAVTVIVDAVITQELAIFCDPRVRGRIGVITIRS